MSYTISIDIEVKEVDVPITMTEALEAARKHFYNEIKPIQDIEVTRYNREKKESETFPVGVQVVMIKITDGTDQGVAPV